MQQLRVWELQQDRPGQTPPLRLPAVCQSPVLFICGTVMVMTAPTSGGKHETGSEGVSIDHGCCAQLVSSAPSVVVD